MTHINEIPVTAPLWEKAEAEDLFQIIEHISSASYHYADDSGREWGTAHECLKSAASKINDLGLKYTAIGHLMRHTSQLVGMDQVFDAVLNDARSREQ